MIRPGWTRSPTRSTTTTLSIDVAAAHLTTSAATGTVYEAGLPLVGSQVAPTTITQAGTLILSESGDTVTVASVNGTTVATSGNTNITGAHGTLTIDEHGNYSYTLTSPDTNNPAPDTFTYTATDTHGNTTTNKLSFTIVDDAPVAKADTATDVSGNLLSSSTHNVVSGAGDITPATGKDIQGADQPVTVTGVEAGSHPGDTLTGGLNIGTAITTALGTLTMASDGSYSYQAKANDPTGVDTFTYTIKDGDGSTSTTTLSIDVAAAHLTTSAATGTVYE